MDIITTDASVIPILQKASEEISTTKGKTLNISYVKSANLLQFLKFGNKADVLVSSYAQACEELSKLGLANPLEHKHIIRNNIYCTKGSQTWKNERKVLVFLNKYHHASEMQIQQIVTNLNAYIQIVAELPNPEAFFAELMQKKAVFCGFKGMMNALQLEKELIKTEEAVNYYACPLIGSSRQSYKILTDYYETQYNI